MIGVKVLSSTSRSVAADTKYKYRVYAYRDSSRDPTNECQNTISGAQVCGLQTRPSCIVRRSKAWRSVAMTLRLRFRHGHFKTTPSFILLVSYSRTRNRFDITRLVRTASNFSRAFLIRKLFQHPLSNRTVILQVQRLVYACGQGRVWFVGSSEVPV